MNTDDAVVATNPYPRRKVDLLPLDAADQELLEEIMSTPTATRTPRPTRSGRRRPWLAPVAAAALVAAVVAGGVALKGGQPSRSGTGSPPVASQDAVPPVDPGLPPTAGNLHQVLLLEDGWSVSNLNDSPYGGSMMWAKGADTLEMTWYRAEDYDSYLADRRATDGTESAARVLGQVGRSFVMWSYSQGVGPAGPSAVPTESAERSPTLTYDEPASLASGPDAGIRVMTILPPVGDWFLEFDAIMGGESQYESVMASLTRVERDAWIAAIDDAVVVPAEGEAFLQEAGQDVPMPDGVSVTVGDLRLPQAAYHARVAFVAPVLCGWAEQYATGDDAALTALRGSSSWPVMTAMASDGDYPSAVADLVEILAGDRSYEGWRNGWGC